jgi:hypothetical protein
MAGTNQFNIGRDTQLTILGAAGVMNFNIITEFDHKPQYKKLESDALDGTMRYRNLSMGHKGSFKLDRSDANVTDYFVQQEANFFAGLNPDQVVITQTVTEANGGVTQYQWTGVTLQLEDAGSWKGLDKINQVINWEATRMFKLS